MPTAVRDNNWRMSKRISFSGSVALALLVAAAYATGQLAVALAPILTGIAFALAALGVLAIAGRWRGVPLGAAILLAAFTTADLAWNNAPNESTGLPPAALAPTSTRYGFVGRGRPGAPGTVARWPTRHCPRPATPVAARCTSGSR